jgi:hypothetical protein
MAVSEAVAGRAPWMSDMCRDLREEGRGCSWLGRGVGPGLGGALVLTSPRTYECGLENRVLADVIISRGGHKSM